MIKLKFYQTHLGLCTYSLYNNVYAMKIFIIHEIIIIITLFQEDNIFGTNLRNCSML